MKPTLVLTPEGQDNDVIRQAGRFYKSILKL